MTRIPHSKDIEVRQAFQRLVAQGDVITTGSSGELLVSAGAGIAPTWQAVSAAVDHGSVGGLGDDDHSIYSLADGTRDFSGIVVGVDPTASNHLATKEYVDSAISFIQEFFLTDAASGVGSYFNMVDQHTGLPESSDPTGSITQNDGQALTEWITVVGFPSITDLEHGIYSVHINVEKTGAGARDVRIYFEVWTRTHPAGAEVLRVTSEVSDLITSRVSIDLHAVLAADIAVNDTDRMVVKFFANGVSGGGDATITLYSEGMTSSHFSMPTSSEVLSTIFLRQDGTKALTGNMAVDAGITIDGRDLSVDGTALDTLVTNAGKVKVDTGATVDFLGAASNDGALRTSTGISYADGGNFVTLTTNDGQIDHNSLSNTHNLTTDIDHASITNAHNLTTDIDHDTLTNYDANKHIDHTGVEIATAATSGISGGGTIAATRNLALNINGLTGESAIAGGDSLPFYDTTAGASRKITLTELSTALGAADEKVKVDSGAAAGYLGAAFNDGVLRTSTGLSYADGGNFVTLALSHLGIESLSDPGADRILFWDNSAGGSKWLTVGDGLNLTLTGITAGFTTRYRGTLSGNQDIVTETPTQVAFDVEDYDGGGDCAAGAFTVPASGYYAVCVGAGLAESIAVGSWFYVQIFVNGVQKSRQGMRNIGAAPAGLDIKFADIVYVPSGQVIDMYVWHDHGANREISSGVSTFMSIHRLS